jgi:hypothetical protein
VNPHRLSVFSSMLTFLGCIMQSNNVSACEFTDAMHLTNAADIIRKQILQSKVTFTGNFEKESVLNGVPQCLLQLVSMIERGPDIESQLENGVTKSDLYSISSLKESSGQSSKY